MATKLKVYDYGGGGFVVAADVRSARKAYNEYHGEFPDRGSLRELQEMTFEADDEQFTVSASEVADRRGVGFHWCY